MSLIFKNPRTDFERLQYARGQIKTLKNLLLNNPYKQRIKQQKREIYLLKKTIKEKDIVISSLKENLKYKLNN
jgi:hypothetical protein